MAGNALEGLGGDTVERENLQKGDSATSLGTSELESGWRYDEKLNRKLARKGSGAYGPSPEQTVPKPVGCEKDETNTAKDPGPLDSKGSPAREHETGNGPSMLAGTAPEASTPGGVDSPQQDTEEPAETPQEMPQESDVENALPGNDEKGEKRSKNKYDKWYHKIF